VIHFTGRMDCGEALTVAIPASPPESGVLEGLENGQAVIGTSLRDAQDVSITMKADLNITGFYTGAFQGQEQGVLVKIHYIWQVVTDEYIIGFLTSSFTSEGVTCNVYHSFELNYSG